MTRNEDGDDSRRGIREIAAPVSFTIRSAACLWRCNKDALKRGVEGKKEKKKERKEEAGVTE